VGPPSLSPPVRGPATKEAAQSPRPKGRQSRGPEQATPRRSASERLVRPRVPFALVLDSTTRYPHVAISNVVNQWCDAETGAVNTAEWVFVKNARNRKAVVIATITRRIKIPSVRSASRRCGYRLDGRARNRPSPAAHCRGSRTTVALGPPIGHEALNFPYNVP